MIKELTLQQKRDLDDYKYECFCYGTSTVPAVLEKATTAIAKMYSLVGKKRPIFIKLSSPMLCHLAINLLKKDNSQLDSQIHSQLHSQLYSQFFSQLRSQLDSQLRSQLHSQLFLQLRSQLHLQLYSQIHSQLRSQLDSQFYLQPRSQLSEKYIYCYFRGQQEYYWIAFYRFLEQIGVKFSKKLSEWLKLWESISQSIGWWYPYEGICFISDRPEVCHIKYQSTGLHCDDGPALRFRDGYELYSLNGTRVDKELVMTPAEELSSQLLIKEKNANIRREIVRKIGIGRCLIDLDAQIIDEGNDITGGPYALINLSIEGEYRPYLKMVNPSTGTIHIEGVTPECKNVDDALNFRKPQEMKDILVSLNGENWTQHGDVCIWPKNAKSLKPYPEIIT